MNARTILNTRVSGFAITVGIVALTLATAYIHLTLGGLLFLLNGLGYVGLAGLIVIAAMAPHPLVKRFDWFPRLALIGYAAATIGGYLVMGPYFWLGWITKGIEVALIALVALDVIRVYRTPGGIVHSAVRSVFGFRAPTAARPIEEGSPTQV